MTKNKRKANRVSILNFPYLAKTFPLTAEIIKEKICFCTLPSPYFYYLHSIYIHNTLWIDRFPQWHQTVYIPTLQKLSLTPHYHYVPYTHK